MKTEFCTTEFEFSHGRTPRGRGSYAFAAERNADALSKDIIWTPSMTYAEAKRYAAKVAAERGIDFLYVLP